MGERFAAVASQRGFLTFHFYLIGQLHMEGWSGRVGEQHPAKGP